MSSTRVIAIAGIVVVVLYAATQAGYIKFDFAHAGLSSASSHMTVAALDADDTHIRAVHNGDAVQLKLQNGGLVVTDTPRGGFNGLQPGDRIVSVDGAVITTVNGFKDPLEAKKDRVPADVIVTRNGNPVHLLLPYEGYSWFY